VHKHIIDYKRRCYAWSGSTNNYSKRTNNALFRRKCSPDLFSKYQQYLVNRRDHSIDNSDYAWKLYCKLHLRRLYITNIPAYNGYRLLTAGYYGEWTNDFLCRTKRNTYFFSNKRKHMVERSHNFIDRCQYHRNLYCDFQSGRVSSTYIDAGKYYRQPHSSNSYD
jgi:hypothetical protein